MSRAIVPEALGDVRARQGVHCCRVPVSAVDGKGKLLFVAVVIVTALKGADNSEKVYTLTDSLKAGLTSTVGQRAPQVVHILAVEHDDLVRAIVRRGPVIVIERDDAGVRQIGVIDAVLDVLADRLDDVACGIRGGVSKWVARCVHEGTIVSA
jgi:hypothetical protein